MQLYCFRERASQKVSPIEWPDHGSAVADRQNFATVIICSSITDHVHEDFKIQAACGMKLKPSYTLHSRLQREAIETQVRRDLY